MLGSWKTSAIVSLVCLFAVQVRAQSAPKPFVDLKYDIEPLLQGCPSVSEFRSIIAKELGYDPYLAGAPMGLVVRVRATATGIEAVINWSVDAEKKGEERHFTARAEECRAMMRTVGFVAAVQVQLMANEEGTEQGPLPPNASAAPQSDSPPNSEVAPSDRRQLPVVTLSVREFEVRSPPVQRRTEWAVLAGAGPAVGLGLGPGVTEFGRFFGAFQHRWVELEFGAEASLVSTKHQAYGGGFRHQLMLGTLAGCAAEGHISACVLAKIGRIQAEGFGVDAPRSPKGLVAEAGPRVTYSLGLDEHFVLLAHLDALCSLTSWTVYLNHVAVWTMPRFAGVAGIDLAARFR